MDFKNSLGKALIKRVTGVNIPVQKTTKVRTVEKVDDSRKLDPFDKFLFHCIEDKLAESTHMYELGHHGEGIQSLAISPDGKFAASGSTDDDGSVKIWNLQERREEFILLAHHSGVRSICFTFDGNFLVTGSSDHTIKIWSLIKKQLAYSIDYHTDGVTSIAISTNGIMVSGSLDMSVKCWDLAQRIELILGMQTVNLKVNCVLFSPDNRLLVSSYKSKLVQFYNLNTRESRMIDDLNSEVTSLAFCSDSILIALGCENGEIKLLNTQRYSIFRTLSDNLSRVNSLSFAPGSVRLSSCSISGVIKIWDLSLNSSPITLVSHSDNVNAVIFTHDGKYLLSGADNKSLRVWNSKEKSQSQVFNYHSRQVRCASISSLGTYLATVSSDNTIVIYDLKRNEISFTIELQSSSLSLAFSKDETMIAFEGDYNMLVTWSLATQDYLNYFPGHSMGIRCIDFSTSGGYIATGSSDKFVILHNLYDESKNFYFSGHTNLVTSVSFSPDSRYLASGSYDKTIKVWDIIEKLDKFTLKGHTTFIRSVLFSVDGKFIVSGSGDKSIKFWNFNQKKEEFTLEGHSSDVYALSFSNDGKYLASGSGDHLIKVWNVQEMCEEFSFVGHLNTVNSVCFSSDGKFIASCSNDKTVRIWNITEKKPKEMFPEMPEDVKSVVFSPNGKLVAVGGVNGTIRVWDMIRGGIKFTMEQAHDEYIRSLSFSPDSKLLASGSEDNKIKLWDTTVGAIISTNFSHLQSVRSVVFSNDGSYLASGSSDKTVKLWNVKNPLTMGEEFTFVGHYGSVNCVAFNTSGSLIASGSYDFTVKVWSVLAKEELYTLHGHSDIVRSVSFSPNGNSLASGSDDMSVKLWNVNSKTENVCFSTNDNTATAVSFSNDGGHLAIGLGNGDIKLWNIKQCQEEFTLKGHTNWINCISFSPDGHSLISCSRDETVKLWELKENLKTYHQESNRSIEFIIMSPDSNYAITGTEDEKTDIWNIEENKIEYSATHFKNNESTSAFSFKGKYIAVCFEGRRIRLYNTREHIETILDNHTEKIIFVTFSKDENLFASSSADHTIKIFKLDTMELHQDFSVGKQIATCLQLSSTTEFIAYGLSDFSILIKRTDDLNEIFYSKLHSGTVDWVEVSNDLKYIASISADNKIKIVNVETRQCEFDYTILSSYVLSICFSNDSKHFFVHTRSGFKIFDVLKKSRVRNMEILEIENFMIRCKIKDHKFNFKLNKAFDPNPVLKRIMEYQTKYNCNLHIKGNVVDTNLNYYSPSSTLDPSYQNFLTFKGAEAILRKSKNIKISQRHTEILISELKYTALHIASYKGDKTALKKCLKPGSDIIIKTDLFGKSPFFYSITKKHQKCVQILLNYLIKLRPENKNTFYCSLNSTRNDFILIINNSSKQLPAYLNKIIIDYEIVSVPLTHTLPKFILSDCFIPNVKEFVIKKKKMDIPATLKQTAFKMPIEPYSKENLQVLESVLNCYNTKIYDNIAIKYMIDYNWHAIYAWAIIYSLVIILNIVVFLAAVFFSESNNLILIPFLVLTTLLVAWEAMQLKSVGKSYFSHPLNYIDITSLFLSYYWILAVFFGFSKYYQEFVLTCLMFFRGLTCFRIIKGVRYYINLVLSSVDSIKYFILLFFYSTLFFGVLFYIGAQKSVGIATLIEKSWSLNFTGDFQLENDDTLIYFSIFLATIVNQILMLNMLISILGDSYDQFMIDKNIIDYREKIDLIMEVQTVFSCKRIMKKKRRFFHILASPLEEEEINKNDWDGKIVYLEKKTEKKIEEVLVKSRKSEENIVRKIHQSEQRTFQNETEIYNDLKGIVSSVNEKVIDIDRKMVEREKRLLNDFANIITTLQPNLPEDTSSQRIEEMSGVNERIRVMESRIQNMEEGLTEILNHIRK